MPNHAFAALRVPFFVAGLVGVAAIGGQSGCEGEPAKVNKTNNTVASTIGLEIDMDKHAEATFAAGCFWGVEAAFRQVEGIIQTKVGYTGGHLEAPSYKQVCTDTTGHAEAVHVVYDPSIVSYEDLLDVFFECHNPTQVDRQGWDVGSQYRSAIFYHDREQQAAAVAVKNHLDQSSKYDKPIATEIVRAVLFYDAEEYHQQYLEKRGQASCHKP